VERLPRLFRARVGSEGQRGPGFLGGCHSAFLLLPAGALDVVGVRHRLPRPPLQVSDSGLLLPVGLSAAAVLSLQHMGRDVAMMVWE